MPFKTIEQMANSRAAAGSDLCKDARPWENPDRDFVREAAEEAADGFNYCLWGYLQKMRHRLVWWTALCAFKVAFEALALIVELEQEGIDEDQGNADQRLG